MAGKGCGGRTSPGHYLSGSHCEKLAPSREGHLQGGIWILPSPGSWIFEKPWILWILRLPVSLYSAPRTLDSAPASKVHQKAWILHVGRPGTDSGFCPNIQSPPKGVDSACWTARRGLWILPQHPASSERRGFCMLDSPARTLDSAPASKIPQKAWILHVGRPGADLGFCPTEYPKSKIPRSRPKVPAGGGTKPSNK